MSFEVNFRRSEIRDSASLHGDNKIRKKNIYNFRMFGNDGCGWLWNSKIQNSRSCGKYQRLCSSNACPSTRSGCNESFPGYASSLVLGTYREKRKGIEKRLTLRKKKISKNVVN